MNTLKQTQKWLLKEYLIPFLTLLIITGAGIALFMFVIGLGEAVAPIHQVMGETTKPTAGRLVYVVTALICFPICAVIASRYAKQGKLYQAFYTGFTAGLLLWQSIGEGAWHFGYWLNGEYINFIRIDLSSSFFLVMAFAFFTGYLIKNTALDFGVCCILLSFLCDWFGHFILEGTYPFVSEYMTASAWYSVCGLIVGVVLTSAAIILPIRTYKDLKGHLLCSMLLYIGISIMAFGFMD